MRQIALALAALVGSLSIPANATEKFQPLGDLNCAVAKGAENALLCEFRAFTGAPAELYFALAEQPAMSDAGKVEWIVLAPGSAGYRKGSLAGEYVTGTAGLGDGSLLGKDNGGYILQARQGKKNSGIAVVELRAVK